MTFPEMIRYWREAAEAAEAKLIEYRRRAEYAETQAANLRSEIEANRERARQRYEESVRATKTEVA